MSARAIGVLGVVGWAMLTTARADAQQRPHIETGFVRDVSRYRWMAAARLPHEVASWRILLHNEFVSDAYILFDDRLSFRDENRLSWQAERPLRGPYELRLRGRSLWYTQSRVFSQEMYSGIRVAPNEHVWIEPALGFAWDQRPGIGSVEQPPLRTDAGPAYGARLSWTPPPLDEYHIQATADAAWQVITPRRGRAVRIEGDASRSFDRMRISTDVAYSTYRRDAYQAVSFLNRTTPTDRLSETVEATASDTLSVGLEIEAPIYEAVDLTGRVDFGVNNRFIHTLGAPQDALYFDTAFSRRMVDGEVGVGYGTDGDRALMLHVAARAGAEVEQRRLTNREDLPPAQASQKTNLLRQADYDQGLFALHGRGRARMGRVTFRFDGSSSILRHDTPVSNLDDRDELYHNGLVGARMAVSRYLDADVTVLGTYYHTVYLSSARSAENNVQRSLRLRPALTWTASHRTHIRLTSEIRATYTVHDFVLPGRRASDQSARELRYDARVEHDFGGGMGLYADAGVSDLHLGRLLWDAFAEIPFDTLRTYSGWVRFQVRSGRGLTGDVGLRFYIRSDFDRTTTVRYPRADASGAVLRGQGGEVLLSTVTRPGRSWIEQVGPTCSIEWPMRATSFLRIEGWLNVQHVRRRLYGNLPEDDADRIRRAARRGERKIIPNLSMIASWSL